MNPSLRSHSKQLSFQSKINAVLSFFAISPQTDDNKIIEPTNSLLEIVSSLFI